MNKFFLIINVLFLFNFYNSTENKLRHKHRRKTDSSFYLWKSKNPNGTYDEFQSYRLHQYDIKNLNIVINEINSHSVHPHMYGEFIELKYTDPCQFIKKASSNKGPSLHGVYLVGIYGGGYTINRTVPFIGFLANLTTYHFRKNSSLFVIGNNE